MKVAAIVFRLLAAAVLVLQLVALLNNSILPLSWAQDGRLILPILLCITFAMGCDLANAPPNSLRTMTLFVWMLMALGCIVLSWVVS